MPIPDVTYADINREIAAAGLPPLGDAEMELVHYLLGRMVGSAWSNYRHQARHLMQVIVGAATTGVDDERAHEWHAPLFEQIPPWPGFLPRPRPPRGWPEGVRSLERLGLSPGRLDDMWRRAVVESPSRPMLPIGVVAEFFPPPIWAAVAALIRCRLKGASLRIQRYLTLYAASPTRPTRSRKPETDDDGEEQELLKLQTTLRIHVKVMERLLVEVRQLALAGHRPRVELVALRSQLDGADGDEADQIRTAISQPSPLLDTWQAETPTFGGIIDLGSTDATDRSAPSLVGVRREWASKNIRFANVARYPSTLLSSGQAVFRDLIILMLLVVLGGRIGAIVRIRVRDIDPAHRFPDGQTGPAIRIFPGKTIPADEPRWKGIPDELYEWLRRYMAYTGVDRYPNRRIFVANWKQVIVKGRSRPVYGEPGKSWGLRAYSSLSSSRSRHPLLPFSDGREGGYSPHTFRHLTEQLARRFGHEWIRTHPEWIGRLSDQAFADALLDHSFGEADRLGYNDLEANRETFAREAALGLWEIAFGDAGARRAPDVDAIREAANAADRVRSELDAVAGQIGELRSRRSALTAVDASAPEEPPTPLPDDDAPKLIRALLALVRELGVMLRQERAERRQIAAIDAELDQAIELRTELLGDLTRAEARLESARTQTVPVDDLLSDAEYQAMLDGVPAAADKTESHEEPVILHETLPTGKFAEALGVPQSTMRRWLAAKSCRYWTPETFDTIIRTFSERHRVVVIDALDHAKISAGAMRDIRRMQSEPA